MEDKNVNGANGANEAAGGTAPAPAPPWQPPKPRGSGWRLFWGIFCVATAVILILKQLGNAYLADASATLIVITALCLAIFIASIPKAFWFGIFFSGVVLAEIAYKQLGYNVENFNLWIAFIVALLLSIGFTVLFHRRKAPRRASYVYTNYPGGGAGYARRPDGPGPAGPGGGPDYPYANEATSADPGSSADAAPGACAGGPHASHAPHASEWAVHADQKFDRIYDDPDGTNIYAAAKFGSAVKYINSEDLRQGTLECSFGAMKVYFDNARIPSGRAEIYLHVSFGALELYVPRTWNVVPDFSRGATGVEEKGARVYEEGAPTLALTGDASFSGVTIIYV